MDKINDSVSAYNHTVTMVERKSFVTNGVKKVENFDDKQFLIDTVMGMLLVKGEELELIKLDTLQGTISIKGIPARLKSSKVLSLAWMLFEVSSSMCISRISILFFTPLSSIST